MKRNQPKGVVADATETLGDILIFYFIADVFCPKSFAYSDYLYRKVEDVFGKS